jgi:hypothetical protein
LHEAAGAASHRLDEPRESRLHSRHFITTFIEEGRMSSAATTTESLETLKYPVGKLALKSSPSPDEIRAWVEEIAALPPKFRSAVSGLNDQQLDTPYRPDGWTVRQVVHHVPDSHMNAYIRVHWALTEDRPTIKAYDQSAWSELPYSKSAPVATSLNLLEATHERWVTVLRSLTPEQWQREYFHPEDQRWFKLSDLVQVYAWHSRHHLGHITGLRQRMRW